MGKLEACKRFVCAAFLSGLMVALSACGADVPSKGEIEVEIGGRQADRLAAFYFGSFIDPMLVDSVITVSGGKASVDTVKLNSLAPEFGRALLDQSRAGTVTREGLRAAVQEVYRMARSFPDDLDAFKQLEGYHEGDSTWFSVTLDGSMTRYRRVIHVPLDALRSAITRFAEDGALIYPNGTAIVGEHLEDGIVLETTLMMKRTDGFWDYAAYGSDGFPLDWIDGEPDPMAVPTQCFGCHYGNRLFEPEKSFPGDASDGVHGSRGIWVSEAMRDPDATSLFDEHRRRTDGVLGIYATLYISALRSSDDRSAAEDELLDALDL